ncbi:MAG: RNA methyltransferase [Lentimicrobium sp.]|nr:RNA methyltransferase [Lentimicrobium sp.]
MLSRNQLKLVTSLRLSKFRQEEGLFVVEGVKMVKELLNSDFRIKTIFATKDWISGEHLPADRYLVEIVEINDSELGKISNLTTPNQVLAVAYIKESEGLKSFSQEWILALDQIRDPGNMGTIIRTADWFGILGIVASTGTVDIWNPKVVQASMGSIFRIPVFYTDLNLFLQDAAKSSPVYGALLDGESISDVVFGNHGILVIGNESHGISKHIQLHVSHRLTIPSAIPGEQGRAESLNASMATGIFCYEINRQTKKNS